VKRGGGPENREQSLLLASPKTWNGYCRDKKRASLNGEARSGSSQYLEGRGDCFARKGEPVHKRGNLVDEGEWDLSKGLKAILTLV